ncbi:8958_t:CDS:1, partial [Paraglomus brasilianum]
GMNDIYEKAIKKLELARRLSLGPNYTSAEEKKINPNDSLIIKALKEKYQNITDEDV